ncbi:MAG TPA: 23S rRNA (adenine(2503)-C(2))-methyltransferase RlmN [Candidatus Dormibacteraeota bacterium]|nr:23S rRNA (adenine(2503)-C(2))-methyltransferase RlmN [Candidatus Dormibacteraeota bacterium]
MRPFSSLTPAEVRAWVADAGQPAYRAEQLLRWFYRSPAGSFEAMATLPAGLRERLAAEFTFSTLAPVHVSRADDGETLKYLFRLADGELLESVCMHYPHHAASSERTTVCLSTQVGCAVRCPFCATGLGGLKRNMETAEVVDQVLEVCRAELRRGRGAPPGGGRVSHLVYMGMGEPLHNDGATLASVLRFTDPAALGLGVRRVTVSTSGVVPAIGALAREGGGVNLAVSLHAPVDGLRDQLVPLNRRWPVAEVVEAADGYSRVTGRRVSYEYVMLRGVNDGDALADDLGRLLRRRLAHVNLIPYNPIPGDPYQSSSKSRIDAFRKRVEAAGVACTVRDTRGRRIDAACGQLRAEALAGTVALIPDAAVRSGA